MSTDIPQRWLQCPNTATRLVGERFFAFKTPLKSNQVPPDYIFTPSMIVQHRFMVMLSYEANLGLWINLTNTDGFYDKAEVESRDILYLRLSCRRNDECPDLNETREFINICSNFILAHTSQLIGIHDTHGFNRTGFLIVAYLVEKQGWDVRSAVKEFAQARPPGIYRADYLLELFTRYGDPTHVPIIELSFWCQELYNDAGKPARCRGFYNGAGNSSRMSTITSPDWGEEFHVDAGNHTFDNLGKRSSGDDSSFISKRFKM